jgi:hypothetical protein
MSNIFYIKLENDNINNTYIAKNLNEAILKFLSDNISYIGLSQLLENHLTLDLWVREENTSAKKISIDIDYNVNIRS